MTANAQISDLPVVLDANVTDSDLVETLNKTGAPSSRQMTLIQLRRAIGVNPQFAQDNSTTSGLTYGYRGGAFVSPSGAFSVAVGGTVALTPSATNYVMRDYAGVVSVNTTGFLTTRIPMAVVTTDSVSITGVTDRRPDAGPYPYYPQRPWEQNLTDVRYPYGWAKRHGGKGDGNTVTDGAITAGTPNFTSATAAFTAADVGKVVGVTGAGVAGGSALQTTIAAYVSPTAVTLAANAVTTVSGATTTYGTDDTAAIQFAMNSRSPNGGNVVLDEGSWLAGALTFSSPGVNIIGAGEYATTLYTSLLNNTFLTCNAGGSRISDMAIRTLGTPVAGARLLDVGAAAAFTVVERVRFLNFYHGVRAAVGTFRNCVLDTSVPGGKMFHIRDGINVTLDTVVAQPRAQCEVAYHIESVAGTPDSNQFFNVQSAANIANRSVTDGAITAGTPNFTSATAAFTAADVGKVVGVTGAGVAGAVLNTTILAYVSPTAVTLAANASTTVAAASTSINVAVPGLRISRNGGGIPRWTRMTNCKIETTPNPVYDCFSLESGRDTVMTDSYLFGGRYALIHQGNTADFDGSSRIAAVIFGAASYGVYHTPGDTIKRSMLLDLSGSHLAESTNGNVVLGANSRGFSMSVGKCGPSIQGTGAASPGPGFTAQVGADDYFVGAGVDVSNNAGGAFAANWIPVIASATTIAPKATIAHVSGTVPIATITLPAWNGPVTLIPDGLWTMATGGNIALAVTAVVGKALILTYDATTGKWYPSYT